MKKKCAFYIHSHEGSVKLRFTGVLNEFHKTGRNDLYRIDDIEEKRDDTSLLGVWENTATTRMTDAISKIDIYNHLSAASMIFGDKANLGILSQSMKTNSLKNKVFHSDAEFLKWCRNDGDDGTIETKRDEAEFVAKIPTANSGSGIWILSKRNRAKLAPEIVRASNSSKIVVQEYVKNPLLRNLRKMQFRVYFIVKGDLSCWICRHGLLQVCNKPFQLQVNEDAGDDVHVTNVCKNKHDEKLFQDEKPCDLPKEYPHVFKSMCDILVDMIKTATPFLSVQRSPQHFEYMGVDFLADAKTRQAYLIECNCPPNNTGSISAEPFHHRVWVDMMKQVVLEDKIDDTNMLWWSRIGGEKKDVVTYTNDRVKLSTNILRWLVRRRSQQ